MGKKALLFMIILIVILITSVHAYQNGNSEFNELFSSTQDFDGLFTMKVPFGKHYSNVAWCLPSGRLGCLNEYWDDDDVDCNIGEDEMVIYYYNNSRLLEYESNAWRHTTDTLTKSYLYYFYQNDGNLVVLKNDIGMKMLPEYVVGVSNDDGSEVVFVGGYDLNMLKNYARSVEFN